MADVVRNVVIIQRRLPQYRIAFFDKLRTALRAYDIELRLLVGLPRQAEISRLDGGNLPWAEALGGKYFIKERFFYANVSRRVGYDDFIIIPQENGLSFFWSCLLLRRQAVALWGHGKNFQSPKAQGLSVAVKNILSARADWWFAYTNVSAEAIRSFGYPPDRITVLNNAVDDAEFRRAMLEFGGNALRDPFHCVFIGSLYQDKLIPFLLSACHLIKSRLPAFQLTIAGAGPERREIELATARFKWIRLVGPLGVRGKAQLLSTCQLILNPGLVGLGICDSFTSAVPMVTTRCGLHSPEISYLNDGVNGVATSFSADDYAEVVLRLLTSPAELEKLRAGCRRSSEMITLDAMVNNFVDGIRSWLYHHAPPAV